LAAAAAAAAKEAKRQKNFAPFGAVPKIQVVMTRKFLIPIKYRNCNFFSVS
jgi:hypothetical protein